jgi:hypothetical protein
MVEIVAEDEVVGVYVRGGGEGEGDAVLVCVFVVWGEGEVGRCVWGGFGEAFVIL